MPLGEESLRVVIAGAASLRGKDLRQHMEESGFPAGEIHLVDEEPAAGTLTEVGGEPAVIQMVDESTFDRARFVFFTGSPAFASRHAPAARRAGAAVIDLTGGLADVSGARIWIPALDALLPPYPLAAQGNTAGVFLSPSAAAIVACSLSLALREFSPARLAIVFFHPVSERGQAAVDELASQTVKLLSFQPLPQEVFDTQVAFNLLDNWGAGSAERLSDARAALGGEVAAYLSACPPLYAITPAITLIHAPVFYGYAFSAYAEFSASVAPEAFIPRLADAGFIVLPASDHGPSNIGVAGESQPVIGAAQRDANTDRGYWFWGAADNMRLAAANATRIAERLLVA